MFSLSPKKFLLPVFLFFLIAIISFLRLPDIKLFSWGVGINLPSWQSYTLSQNGDSMDLFFNGSKLEIAKSSPENSRKFIDDRKELLRLLFEPTTSPYPEFITNIVSCGDEFKPKEEKAKNGVIYSLYAGSRFNYGVCSRDLIKYRSRYGIFDCGRKGIFEINIFSENDTAIDKIAKSFSCNL